MLMCPLCGKTNLKNILAHYKIHVKDITKEKFLELYPNWNQPFQYDLRERKKLCCPLCGKTFSIKNALHSHIRTLHKEEWESIRIERDFKKEQKLKAKGQKCEICGAIKIDLKQHVERKHNIEWNLYCEEYNHDKSMTKIVDEKYRENLSKNKKRFYNETEEGKLLKRKQSEKWKGENNVVHKKGVLEKSMYARSLHRLIPNASNRGIHCWYKNIDRATRSYEELKFIILLEMNGIDFKYEPGFAIKYWNTEKNFMTTYLPDFYINGTYYELKVPKERIKILGGIESTKYYEICKSFNKINVKFSIVSLESFAIENNILVDYIAIEDIIRSKYKSGEIHFICKENSGTVKHITGNTNLRTTNGVTVYD